MNRVTGFSTKVPVANVVEVVEKDDVVVVDVVGRVVEVDEVDITVVRCASGGRTVCDDVVVVVVEVVVVVVDIDVRDFGDDDPCVSIVVEVVFSGCLFIFFDVQS